MNIWKWAFFTLLFIVMAILQHLFGDVRCMEFDNGIRGRGTMDVHMLTALTGATRLLMSDNGEFIAAELSPREAEEPPPLRLVITNQPDDPARLGRGWMLGAPLDSGELLYVYEHRGKDQKTFRIATTAHPDWYATLESPPGPWAFHSAVRTNTHGVVILRSDPPWSSDAQMPAPLIWVASFSLETRTVAQTATFNTTVARYTAVANDTLGLLYWVDEPASNRSGSVHDRPINWTVRAMDIKTLEPKWENSLSLWPGRAAALLNVSGDGTRLAFLQGEGSFRFSAVEFHDSITRGTLLIIDAELGGIIESISRPADDTWEHTYAIVSVPGRPEVALLNALELQNEKRIIWSVRRVDLTSGLNQETWERGRDFLGRAFDEYRNLNSEAIVFDNSGALYIAPSQWPIYY